MSEIDDVIANVTAPIRTGIFSWMEYAAEQVARDFPTVGPYGEVIKLGELGLSALHSASNADIANVVPAIGEAAGGFLATAGVVAAVAGATTTAPFWVVAGLGLAAGWVGEEATKWVYGEIAHYAPTIYNGIKTDIQNVGTAMSNYIAEVSSDMGTVVAETSQAIDELSTSASNYANEVTGDLDNLIANEISALAIAGQTFLSTFRLNTTDAAASMSTDLSAVDNWISQASGILLADPSASSAQQQQDFNNYVGMNASGASTDFASLLQSYADDQQNVTSTLADGVTFAPNNSAANVSFSAPFDSQPGDTVTDAYGNSRTPVSQNVETAAGTSIIAVTAPDGSVTATEYSGLDGTGAIIKGDQENPNGTSQIITYNPDGSSTATTYSGPNGTGSATQIDQENADGTSQITVYNPLDDSSTTTSYTGPNGMGTVTKIDQENNLYDTSEITTYDSDGSSTTTTYDGLNGIGPITAVDLSNATSKVVSSTNSGIFKYTYTGPAFTSFQNPPNFTGTSPLQGARITGNIVVSVGPGVSGGPTGILFYETNVLSVSLTDGVTSYTGPVEGTQFVSVGSGGADASVQLTPDANGNLNVGDWEIDVVNGPYNFFSTVPPGSSFFETTNDLALGGTVSTDTAGVGASGPTRTNPNGTQFTASVNGAGSWSAPTDLTTVTVSPFAGQTQQLSDLLANPSLSAEGLVGKLTIGGAGQVELTGVATVPYVNVNGGGTLRLQGGTLNTDPFAIDPSGNIIGYGTVTENPNANFGGLDGTITASGGTLAITGDVTGAGTLTMTPGAALQLDGGFGVESISFTGTGETLILGARAGVSTPVSGFGAGDFIALEGQQVTSAVYGASANTLTVTGSGGASETLNLVGTYQPSQFGVANGEVEVVGSPACYCRGTLILTDNGEVSVEQLRIGNRVLTMSGEARPIRWIGRRSYSERFAATNPDVLPVLIKHGALSDDVPRRDLWVSPLHAMFLDGMLIPARVLANGVSIVQAETVALVEYFHLELDTHDVILAEGAPSETFVDDDSRGMFQNAAEYRLLYPDAVPMPARYCAPRVEDGEELEAVRREIIARTQPGAPEAPPGNLRGYVERVSRDRIEGWAWDEDAPATPVTLRVLDNDVVIGHVVADLYRDDLEAAGIGDGHHGFALIVPGGLSPLVRHVVRVQRVADSRDLLRSHRVLEATADAAAADTAPMIDVPAPQPVTGSSWRGHVDGASRDLVTGWAQDRAAPETPAALQIIDNGTVIARVLANRYRADLKNAGIGDGRHGFEVRIPGGLSPLARHVIQVRREADGGLVDRPTVLEAATRFDPDLEQAVGNAVASLGASLGADGDHERVLSFLEAQADRLRQLRAETESQRDARLAHRQFQRRWGATRPETESDPGLRALVVDDEVPAADRDAGSQAILSHMRALQRLGYAVSFVAGMDMERANVGIDALEADGIACCRAPFYASVEEVLRRQAGCFDVVYLHRVSNASKYMTLVRQHCPRARVIYSVADLHHVRLARQAEVEDRPELLAQSRQLHMAECLAAWSADAVITHSTTEAALLRQAVPGANVHVVPWAIPARPTRVPFARRRGIAFIGGYAHGPNVDAARFLAESVMPLIWRNDPTIEGLLVGSRMPEAIKRLARPGVTPVGQVVDLAEIFDRVRLTVAPLRYGAGVKGKVLTSLAAGIPCVMSPIAAEGIDLPPPLAVAFGTTAAELAARIVRLHSDEAAYRAVSEAGLSFIEDRFGEAHVLAGLNAALKGRNRPAQREAGRVMVSG